MRTFSQCCDGRADLRKSARFSSPTRAGTDAGDPIAGMTSDWNRSHVGSQILCYPAEKCRRKVEHVEVVHVPGDAAGVFHGHRARCVVVDSAALEIGVVEGDGAQALGCCSTIVPFVPGEHTPGNNPHDRQVAELVAARPPPRPDIDGTDRHRARHVPHVLEDLPLLGVFA